MALPWIKKGMTLLNIHPGSFSSVEANSLHLSHQNVRSIWALVNGENLCLNKRQCRDLSRKLTKTVSNIQELVFDRGGSTDPFGRALENLYLILGKARLLVDKFCRDDWITEVVFHIENAKDFQVILLGVGLCYHAIIEEAKGIIGERSFQHEDLRKNLAPIEDVHNDQSDLKGMLKNQASKSNHLYLQQCLAQDLLVTWECFSQQSSINELDLSRVIQCMKEFNSTWGEDHYLRHGSFGAVCSSTWLFIP